ncbi:TlpA family protein disulfide reductase [Sphingobacterium siyangense]|uniref:TlpA family protein disulfide reductase n=1 Tax=Sphingobacterium siyangense TaxID=459529 RepID=UPI003C78238F
MKHRSILITALLDKVAYQASIKDAVKNNLKKMQYAWGKEHPFDCIVYSLRQMMSACTPVPMPKSVKGMFSIRTILILFLMMFSFHMFSLSAQTPRKDSGAEGLLVISPLKVGDRLPESLLNLSLEVSNHPQGNQSIRLSDYSDRKLILLDFWATWCGSCIEKFSELAKIQQEFGSDVLLLGATEDSKSKVNAFFAKREKGEFRLLSAVGNKLLASYFPHKMIPHYIWVGGDGKVLTVTSSGAVSITSVRDYLQNGIVPLSDKFDMDRQAPLFLSEYYPASNPLIHYAIFTKGSFRGYPQGAKYRYDDGKIIGRSFTNISLLELYEGIARGIFDQMNDRYTPKRRKIAVKETGPIKVQEYSFDFINPPTKASSLYSDMLSSLNSYSGYKGVIEKVAADCYSLIVIDSNKAKSLLSKGAKPRNTLFKKERATLVNLPLRIFIARAEELKFITWPIQNDTGIESNVDMLFERKIDSLAVLQKELAKYGLALKQTLRLMNTLVITDNKNTND